MQREGSRSSIAPTLGFVRDSAAAPNCPFVLAGLLLKPGGFEGFGPVHVGGADPHPAVAERPDASFVLLDLNAASLAHADCPGKDYDPLTSIEEFELVGVEAPPLPDLGEFAPEPCPALAPR